MLVLANVRVTRKEPGSVLIKRLQKSVRSIWSKPGNVVSHHGLLVVFVSNTCPFTSADPGEGPGGGGSGPSPLFLDQTQARKAEKKIETAPVPHPPLSEGLDPPLVYIW